MKLKEALLAITSASINKELETDSESKVLLFVHRFLLLRDISLERREKKQ